MKVSSLLMRGREKKSSGEAECMRSLPCCETVRNFTDTPPGCQNPQLGARRLAAELGASLAEGLSRRLPLSVRGLRSSQKKALK